MQKQNQQMHYENYMTAVSLQIGKLPCAELK